jgi:hypothetical protein
MAGQDLAILPIDHMMPKIACIRGRANLQRVEERRFDCRSILYFCICQKSIKRCSDFRVCSFAYSIKIDIYRDPINGGC